MAYNPSEMVSDDTEKIDEECSTSPTARNFPSVLNEMQVAALILSFADHALLLGESDQSVLGDARGEAPIPPSRNAFAARLRLSF